MAHLAKAFLQEIEEYLNENFFLAEDFNIETKKYSSNSVQIIITYTYCSEYIFNGIINNNEETFSANFSPGTITFSVRRENLSKNDFLNTIDEWLDNLRIDITKTPLARKVMNHEEILKSFQEKILSMGEEGDRFFTNEEGEKLRIKLTELETSLKESVLEKNEEKKTQEQEIKRLSSEVNTLREQLEVFNKRNWFLSFSVRLFNWIKRNPDVTRRVAGFSRELLPEDAKDIVTQEALDQLLPQSSIEVASDTEK